MLDVDLKVFDTSHVCWCVGKVLWVVCVQYA